MKHFAFIGLGPFGMSMLERIAGISDQIIAADEDPERIEHVKELVSGSIYNEFCSMRKLFERVFP